MDGYKDDSGNSAPLLDRFAFEVKKGQHIVIPPDAIALFLCHVAFCVLCEGGKAIADEDRACVEDIIALLPRTTRQAYATIDTTVSLPERIARLGGLVRRDNVHLSPDDSGRMAHYRWVGMQDGTAASRIALARPKRPGE